MKGESNHRRDTILAKAELMRLLGKLTEDSIVYVWRPILYAWAYTEYNDPESMTEDDMNRMNLLVNIANGSAYVVKCAAEMAIRARRDEDAQ